MRFKITLNRTPKQRMLPMDYQYYLSAWIYKVIGKADHEFANFLHSEGYKNGNKQFKLFNYSPLDFGKPRLWKEKTLFEISPTEVHLKVSFMLSSTAEKFIIGLFNNQQVYIGNRFNGINFTVARVERLPETEISTSMRYRASSPIVVSLLTKNDKYAQYLSPENEAYADLLRQHFINKYNTVPHEKPLPEDFDFQFTLKNKPKSKLISIRPDTPQQSKIRGFIYEFDLTAPPEIHQLILAAGFGEKNATGFGWCEKI